MTNKPKRKGSLFERQVADYLGTERLPAKGSLDKGDVHWPGWVLELKAVRQIDLAGALGEAERAAKKHGIRRFACIHKKRMGHTSVAYVTMPLWAFREITDVVGN